MKNFDNDEYYKKSIEIVDRICFDLCLSKSIDCDVFNAAMIGCRMGLEEEEKIK